MVIHTSDEKKLKEMIIHIAMKSSCDQRFGSTKLNKLLYACDMLAFAHLGHSISNTTYVKREFGPTPKRMPAVLDELRASQGIAFEQRPVGAHTQNRPVALRNPDYSEFESSEIALIDNIIDCFEEHNATSISNWSHELAGWRLAEYEEDIPLSTVFVSDRDITEAEIQHGHMLASKYGWDV